MNAAATIPHERPSVALLDELGLLADATRCRLLAVLDGAELTVAELCDVLALPQSTVSRHLKTLVDAGWLAARRDGTSRWYGALVARLPDASQRLWSLVREQLADTPAAGQDRRRLAQVMERRRVGSAAFFAGSAAEWDALRAELFGATSDLRLLPALLDPAAVVGDLGCGSGVLAATVAPFVAEVVAVDSSPEMLDIARARLQGQDNVRLLAGPVEALPLADASLDVALLVHVLHHLPDPAVALAEAWRVLRPGGRLVLADLLPHDDEALRHGMGHVWLGFGEPWTRAALAAAGFEAERWQPLAAEAGARGPGLFVATARRPQSTTTSTPPRGRTR